MHIQTLFLPVLSVEARHARRAQSAQIVAEHAHKTLVRAVRLHVAEAEAAQVARVSVLRCRSKDAWATLHGEGRNELRVPEQVVPDAHVAQLRVVHARQNLEKVMPFGDALVRRARVLQRTQLQLALEVPVRIRSRVLEIVHVVLRGLVERHESA